jgi:hypothetical protein
VVAHGGALPKVIEAIDASDGEHEEIAKIGGLRAEESAVAASSSSVYALAPHRMRS